MVNAELFVQYRLEVFVVGALIVKDMLKVLLVDQSDAWITNVGSYVQNLLPPLSFLLLQ